MTEVMSSSNNCMHDVRYKLTNEVYNTIRCNVAQGKDEGIGFLNNLSQQSLSILYVLNFFFF